MVVEFVKIVRDAGLGVGWFSEIWAVASLEFIGFETRLSDLTWVVPGRALSKHSPRQL